MSILDGVPLYMYNIHNGVCVCVLYLKVGLHSYQHLFLQFQLTLNSTSVLNLRATSVGENIRDLRSVATIHVRFSREFVCVLWWGTQSSRSLRKLYLANWRKCDILRAKPFVGYATIVRPATIRTQIRGKIFRGWWQHCEIREKVLTLESFWLYSIQYMIQFFLV